MKETQKNQIAQLRAAGNGYGKISQTLGIPLNTVKSFCRQNNLAGKAEKPIVVKQTGGRTFCENCGKEIIQIAKQKPRRFCSDKCRNIWWNSHLDQVNRKAYYHFKCQQCGKEFVLYGDRRRKFCSHECYVKARFKGGSSNE